MSNETAKIQKALMSYGKEDECDDEEYNYEVDMDDKELDRLYESIQSELNIEEADLSIESYFN